MNNQMFYRDIRKWLGMTQKELARFMGVNSKFVISDWERGKYNPLRKHREAIGALANAYFKNGQTLSRLEARRVIERVRGHVA